MSLVDFIKELVSKRFYGEVLIKLEAGKIVLVRETKNRKDIILSE